MKKLNLSLAAIFAMGTFAVAGGDIAPVEPVVDAPVVVASTGNFYLGLAYGYLTDQLDVTDVTGQLPGNNLGPGATLTAWDENHGEVMLQAGYNFNEYIAIEARYWIGLTDTINLMNYSVDTAVNAFGIYVKPQYPVTEAFNVYALLGYAATDYTFDVTNSAGFNNSFATDSDDGFSWGLGASYSFTDNVAVFVDYVSIYNNDKDAILMGDPVILDRTIDSWNFGVTYNF